eukprot:scaffold6388_cov17-Tisochrysis_lutea.AAC.1
MGNVGGRATLSLNLSELCTAAIEPLQPQRVHQAFLTRQQNHFCKAVCLLAYMQYNEMKSENDGQSPYITAEQQHWLSVQQLLSSTTIEVRVAAGFELHITYFVI